MKSTLTRSDISKISASDLLIELRHRGLKLEDVKALQGKAECPKCGKKGRIEKDFGVRVMRGQVWPQSWCRTCRAKATHH